LFIDKVIQKTVIDVNEKGVEAAAVTAIMVGVTSAGPPETNDPVLMILDHPFQFFIYDKTEELVLFEGRVGAPEVPETEPEVPLLDAALSDSDFWSSNFYVNPVEPPVFVTATSSTATNNLDPSQLSSHHHLRRNLHLILLLQQLTHLLQEATGCSAAFLCL
jgi:hypothetical protein